MANVPSSRGYSGGFAVDLMAKDVSLAVAAAHAAKSPLPLGGPVLQMYNMLRKQGYGGKDFSSVFEFLSKEEKKSD
jgi:3-hydroxyisobutyrate dehydrogenase